MQIGNVLLRLFGWKAALFLSDPLVYDRWRWIRRHLTRGSLRTLDAGCSRGHFTLYCAKLGNQAVGISLEDENNKIAAYRAQLLNLSGVKFITADLRSLRELAPLLGVFDQILCLEVIEHIIDDRAFVTNLAALLRPGGKLLVSAPFKHYVPLVGDRLSVREDGGHVRWGYTHDELRQLLEAANLQVVAEEFVSGFVSQQICNIQRILTKLDGRLAWVLTAPLRILVAIDRPLTKLLGYPYLSVGVVATKR